jgi:hypothetical protein
MDSKLWLPLRARAKFPIDDGDAWMCGMDVVLVGGLCMCVSPSLLEPCAAVVGYRVGGRGAALVAALGVVAVCCKGLAGMYHCRTSSYVCSGLISGLRQRVALSGCHVQCTGADERWGLGQAGFLLYCRVKERTDLRGPSQWPSLLLS